MAWIQDKQSSRHPINVSNVIYNGGLAKLRLRIQFFTKPFRSIQKWDHPPTTDHWSTGAVFEIGTGTAMLGESQSFSWRP